MRFPNNPNGRCIPLGMKNPKSKIVLQNTKIPHSYNFSKTLELQNEKAKGGLLKN